MENKEHSTSIGRAAVILLIFGIAGCGVACFCLNQSLEKQRSELREAKTQLAALDHALKIQQQDLNQACSQLAEAAHKITETQESNRLLSQQITELNTKAPKDQMVSKMNLPPAQFPGMSVPPVEFPKVQPDVPAADSVEGQLHTQGKHWERADGPPNPGDYVQDMMRGRLNQPQGRGMIGKVMAVAVADNGTPCATVDFGRGCTEGIMCSELSLIRFVAPEMR